MDSESETDAPEEELESESESESGSESTVWEHSVRECWETVARLIRYARGMSRLEALNCVLPHLPAGPQASAIEHALRNTNSLPTTLRASEKVAIAMARAAELLELV